jgi:hypothetical protein
MGFKSARSAHFHDQWPLGLHPTPTSPAQAGAVINNAPAMAAGIEAFSMTASCDAGLYAPCCTAGFVSGICGLSERIG